MVQRTRRIGLALGFASCLALGLAITLAGAKAAPAPERVEYRVLATNKTSTMQKEMQEAAEAGFQFGGVMGGETSFGGSEVVVVMQKTPSSKPRYEYRLLATSKTGTMQKEMQEAGDAGGAGPGSRSRARPGRLVPCRGGRFPSAEELVEQSHGQVGPSIRRRAPSPPWPG